MICTALHGLIEECTVILGWCYTSVQVEDTKSKQKEVTRSALTKMFPAFDMEICLAEDNKLASRRVGDDSNGAGRLGIWPKFGILTLVVTIWYWI